MSSLQTISSRKLSTESDKRGISPVYEIGATQTKSAYADKEVDGLLQEVYCFDQFTAFTQRVFLE